MSDIQEATHNVAAFAKKHWVGVLLAVLALYFFVRYFRGNSAPQASGNAASAAALQSAYAGAAQMSAGQAAQIQLAQQTEADSASVAHEKNRVAETQAIGQTVLALGSTVAGTIAAQTSLASQAIASAGATNQAALAGSAAVAAEGVAALPGALESAGHLIGVQSGNFGTTLIGFGRNVSEMTGSALNSIAVNGGSAANSAAASSANAANANAGVNIQALQTAGQIFGGMGMLA